MHRSIALAFVLTLGFFAATASAEQCADKLRQDKSQQNSADEAAVRGRLEDGIKPGDPSAQTEANKKVEDAAVEAKRKSDAKKK